MNTHPHPSLVEALVEAPRLSFRVPIMDVFTEVGGILAVWRNDTLLHVQATDDLFFELHLLRHGLWGRSRFLAELFEEVVWPAAADDANRWTSGGPDEVMRSLVRDQLTYSLQVMAMAPTAIDVCTRELRDRMDPAGIADVAWADGWYLPSEIAP